MGCNVLRGSWWRPSKFGELPGLSLTARYYRLRYSIFDTVDGWNDLWLMKSVQLAIVVRDWGKVSLPDKVIVVHAETALNVSTADLLQRQSCEYEWFGNTSRKNEGSGQAQKARHHFERLVSASASKSCEAGT